MRKMPHSVVVATTSVGAAASPTFRGMTVSSFTTLTLTPTPIITFNIRRPSRSLDAIRDSRQFLVHILSATPSGAAVAHNFTQGNTADVFASQRFAVWNVGSSRPLPLLAAPGVTKILRCRVRGGQSGGAEQGLIQVGDHVLVLADVEGVIEPPPSKERAALEERGLSYMDRAYRGAGEVIELGDGKDEEALD